MSDADRAETLRRACHARDLYDLVYAGLLRDLEQATTAEELRILDLRYRAAHDQLVAADAEVAEALGQT